MALKFERERVKLESALSEINMIPLIDIMLVLLIIFMITAPMMHTGIEVALPRAETRTSPAEERMIITITKDRKIFLENKPVSLQALEDRLKEYFYGKQKKVAFIKGDKTVPYGFVISVIDRAKKAGAENVGLIVEFVERK
ncbi:MAG: ExbD/TolR family protein [Candidatus Aminicenantia bacterium]